MFLGRTIFTPSQSLPWYNTLVWTAIATPVGFLAFAIVGTIRSAGWRKRANSLAVLATGHWLFLLALRALPHTPGHDGVRQFLPAFGCLALVAGVGAAWAVARFGRWGKVLIALALAEGAGLGGGDDPRAAVVFQPDRRRIAGRGEARDGADVLLGCPHAGGAGRAGEEHADGEDRPVRDVHHGLGPPDARRARCGSGSSRSTPARPRGTWSRTARASSGRSIGAGVGVRPEVRVLVEKFGVPLVWRFPYDVVETMLRTPGDAR